MIEIYKNIEGYEGLYQVSNLGNVKSLERINKNNRKVKEKILKPLKLNTKYLSIVLCKNGKNNRFLVHRLVAQAFIPNPENKPCIDHINTDRTDNRVENLRWVTYKENSNNPITKTKQKENNHKPNLGKFGKEHYNSKPILQFTLNGEFVKRWDSAIEIKNELNFNNGYICSCCKGKGKSSNGYKWAYAEDYERIPLKYKKVV